MVAKTKTYLIITTCVITILVIAFISTRIAFYKGYLRLNYPSTTQYPVQGIDISHHQKTINWQELNKQQVQFVFIKATEGGNFKDTQFQNYWPQAKAHHIPISAYHFFTLCNNGKEQAKHFIQTVPKHIIELPPAVDLEFGGNCKDTLGEQLISEIDQYIQTIEAHYQRKVIIYATQEFYNAYLTNQFLDNPIWIRDIYKKPKLTNNRPWLFWQYANRGHLKGINGFIDLNVFAGTQKEFQALLAK